MITVTEIRPNVFEVIETIMSFNDIKATPWYYDLTRNLISENSDFPDTWGVTRQISTDQLAWFEKWHRPKIKHLTDKS